MIHLLGHIPPHPPIVTVQLERNCQTTVQPGLGKVQAVIFMRKGTVFMYDPRRDINKQN